MGRDIESRIRNVTAVLGPTNTGKTHLAIERMVGHKSGLIGLPLRLLAREVYDKVAAKVGAEHVALVTGEEKIKPDNARYWVATVEAMPLDLDVEFVAIDEVQLAADPERGHVFTDRILNARGTAETLLLGAQTMQDAITDLIHGANFISRPRLSKLTYAGHKKITRLPTRSAVIAFSANEVYAIAELIRRQRGGTAVVLGALSPRTRNAQVALYQSGDVDFLVATDAIGMGLNLDVDHVAFSALRKFDGHQHRDLFPAEIGQIAGRAGRHMNDGTFGVTGNCPSFDDEMVERLETHVFDPVKMLQWRNRDLDFSSLETLKKSLREPPHEARLARARAADDELALEAAARDGDVASLAANPEAVEKLWDVCQIPDYRKISHQSHAELVSKIYQDVVAENGIVPEDWFAAQVAMSDRADGDIDTLSTRLAHIRTWTYVANRSDWLKDPEHWQGKTREIEDRLSDALHERLTQRFVDERTSALMRGMREKSELSADIAQDGTLTVENHAVGKLNGFRFQLAGDADGVHARALKGAAAHVLTRELALRVRRVLSAKPDAFTLDPSGRIVWQEQMIGQLEAGEDPLRPLVQVVSDDYLPAADRDKVKDRLSEWVNALIEDKLKPLIAASDDAAMEGLAKGVGFQLRENFGVLRREDASKDIKSLDQAARAQLRRHGVRFGAFNIYFPALLKPGPAHLASVLWALKHGEAQGLDRYNLPSLPRAGLTSVAVDEAVPASYYRANGYHVCGPRVLRIDILERLADLIRPLVAWRSDKAKPGQSTPPGASGDGGFFATADMMSVLGCSAEELGATLQALGFESKERPKSSVPVVPAAEQDSKAETTTADSQPENTAPLQDDTHRDSTVASGVSDEPESVPASASQDDAQKPDAAKGEQPGEASEAQSADQADQEAVPAVEVVWRPMRRHRGQGQHKQSGSRKKGKYAKKTSSDAHGKPGSDADHRTRRGERTGPKRSKSKHARKNGRSDRRSQGPRVHQSKPTQTRDEDSPFAALSKLKDQLEKKT